MSRMRRSPNSQRRQKIMRSKYLNIPIKQITALKDKIMNEFNESTEMRSPAYGVMQIDDKPATSLRFQRNEIDGKISYAVSFHMGSSSVAKLKDLDAVALAGAVGDKNAATILENSEAKGILKGEELQNEYGLSPAEKARRLHMQEQAELEELELDSATELNIVEQDNTPELEVINSEEVIARAAMIRQLGREQLMREQERLGLRAEEKRIEVENLSEKVQEQDNSNDQQERTGNVANRPDQQLTEEEKNRQIKLMEQVRVQFKVVGSKFLGSSWKAGS
jgi:hypothetical protein